MARILVFEDDDAVRNLIVKILQMDKHLVEGFSYSEPVLEQKDFNSVNLVIATLTFPLERENIIENFQHDRVQVPVIALCSDVYEIQPEFLYSMGIRKILKKPFDVREFIQAVRDEIGIGRKAFDSNQTHIVV